MSNQKENFQLRSKNANWGNNDLVKDYLTDGVDPKSPDINLIKELDRRFIQLWDKIQYENEQDVFVFIITKEFDFVDSIETCNVFTTTNKNAMLEKYEELVKENTDKSITFDYEIWKNGENIE